MRLLMLRLIAVVVTSGVCAFAQATYGSVSAGYSYINAEGPNEGRVSLNGWYALPAYNLTPRLSVFANIIGVYGPTHQNVHSYSGGPLYKFPTSTRFTPVIFTEIGDLRISNAGAVTNSFEYVAGAGVEVKLNKHVSLQIIPAEYVLSAQNGSAHHNYLGQFGFTFPLGKKK